MHSVKGQRGALAFGPAAARAASQAAAGGATGALSLPRAGRLGGEERKVCGGGGEDDGVGEERDGH